MGIGQTIAGHLGLRRRDETSANFPLIKEAPRSATRSTPTSTSSSSPSPASTTLPGTVEATVRRGPTAITKAGELPIELSIPFQSIAVTTATSQISALVFCLAWSVKFNFYESTATHCRVDNYLPSLSATLDFTPQRDVWRACIGLSGIPRYFIAYLYYKLIYKSKVLLWFHWIEITALLGLSIVDSIRYFAFHATCVGIFLLTSIIHMTLVCNDHVTPDSTSISVSTRHKLKRTKVVKKHIAIVNFITIVSALYLYDRHNRYCESGVYSMFSFLEYIVITANVIYHLQAYYDLDEYSILVASVSTGPLATAIDATAAAAASSSANARGKTMIDKKRS